MSDIEDGNFDGRDSRSPSKSDRGSPVRVKSESRSGSPSSSRAAKHSESRSRSKSRSHSRRHSNRRYSRSRSPSNRKKSRSYSPEYRKKKSQSTSPNRRHPSSRSHDFRKETFSQGGGGGGEDARANPNPNQCLGVFGLSLYTTEKDLREVFGRYGPLAGVNVVYDQRTGRSRGFAFVYFERIADSKEAMERANGMELDGRHIRVDFSITKRAHTPTPGIYMGRPTHNGGGGERSSSSGGGRRGRDSYDRYDDRRGGGYDRGYDRGDRGYDRYDEYDKYSRRRSPSPYYSRYRSRSRSRSYSPRRY